VTYQGNSGVNRVTLGNNFALQTNLPGSQLFSASGGDVFLSLQDLITGLQGGNTASIGTAVTEVGSALNYIDSQQVFYGSALNQLSAQQTYLGSETTELAQQHNTEGGADLDVVISNLTSSQTSLQAALEAVGQTDQTDLFSYLR
jgi:flagellar hook-associated protein 3 FlgL